MVLAPFLKPGLYPFDNVGELSGLQLFVGELDVSRTTGSPTTRLTAGRFGELARKVASGMPISGTFTSGVQCEALGAFVASTCGAADAVLESVKQLLRQRLSATFDGKMRHEHETHLDERVMWRWRRSRGGVVLIAERRLQYHSGCVD
jgi:hypothetical protein